MQPFADTSDREALAHLVLETGVLVTRFARRAIRSDPDVSMSLAGFRSLAFLKTNPGTSLSELADHLWVGVSTASRRVDDLVEAGLVDRRPDPNDRRRLYLSVTAAGVAAITRSARPAHRRTEALLDDLDAADLARVQAGFRLVRELLDASLPTPRLASGVDEAPE